MHLDRLFQAGVGIALAGVVWTFWPHPTGAYYSPWRWGPAAYHRNGPTVLIDRGHWNESTADPHFAALAQVLANDGYRVSINRQEFVPELLRTAQVVVVSDALGFTGWLQRFGLHPRADAFDPREISALRDWVRSGGSLLIVADRPAAVEAERPLAAAFGVSLADGQFAEAGQGRVMVLTTQLADGHNRTFDSRSAMLQIAHWLSRAPDR